MIVKTASSTRARIMILTFAMVRGVVRAIRASYCRQTGSVEILCQYRRSAVSAWVGVAMSHDVALA